MNRLPSGLIFLAALLIVAITVLLVDNKQVDQNLYNALFLILGGAAGATTPKGSG